MSSKHINIHYQALRNVCFLYRETIKKKKQTWTAIHERNEKYLNSWIKTHIPLFNKQSELSNKRIKPYVYDKNNIYFKIVLKTRLKKGGYGEIWESKIVYIDDSLVIKRYIIKKGKIQRLFDGLREMIIHNELYCHFKNKKIGSIETRCIPEMKCVFRTNQHYCIGIERMDGTLFDYIDELLGNKQSENMILNELFKILEICCDILISLQKTFQFMHRDFHGSNIMYRYDDQLKTYHWYIIDFGMACIETKTARIYPPTDSKHYSMIHGMNSCHDMRLLFLSIYGHFRDRLPYPFVFLCFNMFKNMFHYLSNSTAYNEGIVTENNEYFFYRAYGEIVHIQDPIFDPEHLRKCIKIDKMKDKVKYIDNISSKVNIDIDNSKHTKSDSALRKSFKLFSL